MRDALIDAKKTYCTAIGMDSSLRAQLAAVAEQIPEIRFVRMLDGFPDEANLGRFLRTNPAPVVFLNASSAEKSAKVAAALEAHDPTLQVIAIGPGQDETVLLALLRAGVREYLEVPLRPQAVADAIERRSRVLSKMPNPTHRPAGSFISFLPAKAGVGASTLAANVSSAIASRHGRATLLTDTDFNSGTVAFRYRLDPMHGIGEALARADELDDELWSSLITRSDELHVLPSRLRPEQHADGWRMNRLLEFIRARYEFAVFDLSGNLEEHTFDLMRDSKIVYLVATQELDCLHLARTKAEFLRQLDLGDRVRVLINRFHPRHSLNPSQIEDLLKAKVEMVFPNEYRTTEKSVLSGLCVNANTPLGRSFEACAAHLVEKAHEPKKHRFLEYFKLPAFEHWARTSAAWRD